MSDQAVRCGAGDRVEEGGPGRFQGEIVVDGCGGLFLAHVEQAPSGDLRGGSVFSRRRQWRAPPRQMRFAW
ncbi:hypothetical protein SSP24_67010 [Streptomyces spinoverrucosus]|uniref:Uncharacterized protein n=1 Tax=Streptomyces spinoverrucosus TaxID=284043 RepID=A0A4Y3VVR5_9ACTN|nr:hypothetical protein SSP24_67010 [Streptomyces spinoverrucosus]GHB93556.1 hypothetical protein GCM10010397_77910 [Streptomyces spinoverrucosus]